MAGITLEQATTMLAAYVAAETALLASQSYSIQTETGTRTLTRANLAEVVAARKEWEQKVANLSRSASGRSRTRYFVR